MAKKTIRLRDAGNSYKVHLNKRVLERFGWKELDRIQIIYDGDIVTISNITMRYDIEELQDEVSK